jgi:acetyl-CoA carboxylase biotin carboxylase subunit
VLRGSAIECRINAEDPEQDFRPTPGQLTRVELPGGPFTRVDTHSHTGYRIPPNYDSLLAKVITWGPDRPQAAARMARALGELVIEGPRIATTTGFAARIIDHPLFRAGRHTTDLVERMRKTEEEYDEGASHGQHNDQTRADRAA